MKSQLGERERASFPLLVRSLVQLLCSSTEQQCHWQVTLLLRTGEQASSSQPNAVGVQVGEREQWFVCSVLNVSSDLASLHRLPSFFLAFLQSGMLKMAPSLQMKDVILSLEMETKSHCQRSLSDLFYFTLFLRACLRTSSYSLGMHFGMEAKREA